MPTSPELASLHDAARQAYATCTPIFATAGGQAAIQMIPCLSVVDESFADSEPELSVAPFAERVGPLVLRSVQSELAHAQIWSRAFPWSQKWLRLGLPGKENEWDRLTAAFARLT